MKKQLLFSLIMLIAGGIGAQDIHFSQFYMAPLHLNPAMTGVMECTDRLSANYRNQWSSVITKPFQTYSVSYDKKFAVAQYDYAGAGLSIWGDQVGTANLSTYQARLSGSYSKYLGGDRRKAHYLVGGVEIAYTSRSINFDKLRWGIQHDGQGDWDPTILDQENLENNNYQYLDMGVGLLYFSRLSEFSSFYFGLSSSHINRPQQSFLDNNQVKLYSKYTVHGGAEFSLNENFSVLPGFVSFFQGPSFQLNAGTSARFYLSNFEDFQESFQFGVWARMVNNYNFDIENQMVVDGSTSFGVDAVILSARFDYQQFGVGFSYDINVSDLSEASNGRGGFELSLIYNICGPERRGVYCPKF